MKNSIQRTRQNATKSDENSVDEKGLTPAMVKAVNALAMGASVTDAATTAGVARQTVSGWLNNNGSFVELLRSREKELWLNETFRLRAMSATALDVLYQGLTSQELDLKDKLGVAKLLISTLNLPAFVAEKFMPFKKEFWREATPKEVEQHRAQMRSSGLGDGGDLSNLMIKLRDQ
jgi:hypothetical protein